MKLTQRQQSILFGLAAGLSLSDLATRLNLSASSVAFHRRGLGRVLGLTDGNPVKVLRAAVVMGYLPKDVLAHSVSSLFKKVV
jgi:DNA-binding NarL/FixJ family response regulator